MKVVFLSTYPPAPCGIGEYTRELRRAVERAGGGAAVDVAVVAERHPSVTGELDADVARVWRRGVAWDVEAAQAVVARRPALVHVQHEEAILHQDGRLIRFLRAVGKAGIARIVTLHSVYGGRWGLPFWWPPPLFHRSVAAEAEAIVVHQSEGGRDYLERQGVSPHLIHVIPHGTPVVDRGPRQDARARLGIPADAKVALSFGVIHPKKNVHTVVRAAAQLAMRLPRLRLVVAGRGRTRTMLDKIYVARLERLMRPGIAAGYIDYRPGFITAGDIPAYLAATDVVLFPYDQRYGSASGVFHLALGAGRATICSSSPKFGEAREIFARQVPEAFAPAYDVGAWARAMETMLVSADLRAEAEALARNAATATSWEVVGLAYARLYAQVVTRGRGSPSCVSGAGEHVGPHRVGPAV